MNAAFMMIYNRTPEQLELTKAAVQSALDQDIPVDLYVVDNGSTFETMNYLRSVPQVRLAASYTMNRPPCHVANEQFARLFAKYDQILCLPNDVRLPSGFYRELLKWPRGVVTASETRDPNYDLSIPVEVQAVSENTPMAVLVLRKWAYDALMVKDGHFFDPQFDHYGSDCDWALRTASCGIRGIQLNIPYYHYGSASHRLAPPEVGDFIRRGADADRQRFIAKWGFRVDDLEYGQRAQDINFKGKM